MGVNEPIEQIRNPQNAGRAAMGTELDGPAESSVKDRLRPAFAHYRGLPKRRLSKQLRPAQLAAGRPLTDAHLDVRGLAHFWPSSTERTQGAVAGTDRGWTDGVVCHDKWHLLYTLFGTVRSSPRHTTGPVTSNSAPYGKYESDICSNKMPFSVVRRCQIIWQFTARGK